jgi:hypothetical protein
MRKALTFDCHVLSDYRRDSGWGRCSMGALTRVASREELRSPEQSSSEPTLVLSVLIMKRVVLPGTTLLCAILFASCATPYQSQGLTGGYSDFLTAPDEATIMFHGNGYTPAERVVLMTALRCADVTLQRGYRYFVVTGAADVSGHFSFTTPGYATTYGSANAYGFGNFATAYGTSYTTVTPPQTFNIYKPGLSVAIKMSNSESALEPFGAFFNGQKARPKDAAFLSQSLRQFLGVKS